MKVNKNLSKRELESCYSGAGYRDVVSGGKKGKNRKKLTRIKGERSEREKIGRFQIKDMRPSCRHYSKSYLFFS
jgi:hypothetical protein